MKTIQPLVSYLFMACYKSNSITHSESKKKKGKKRNITKYVLFFIHKDYKYCARSDRSWINPETTGVSGPAAVQISVIM